MTTDKRYAVDDVVIETTRRCNLNCTHCLRGDPRDADLNQEVVQALWKKIRSIETLTFTGGEPLLNYQAMLSVVRNMRNMNGNIHRIYIATNGYVMGPDIMGALGEVFFSVEEPSMNLLHVSNTVYHRENTQECAHTQKKNTKRFKDIFSFATTKHASPFKDSTGQVNPPKLLARGRASNREDAEDTDRVSGWVLDEKDRSLCAEHLYITVHGDCFPYCNFSYEDMDALIEKKSPLYLGNIKRATGTIPYMAKKWNNFVKNCGGSVRLIDYP